MKQHFPEDEPYVPLLKDDLDEDGKKVVKELQEKILQQIRDGEIDENADKVNEGEEGLPDWVQFGTEEDRERYQKEQEEMQEIQKLKKKRKQGNEEKHSGKINLQKKKQKFSRRPADITHDPFFIVTEKADNSEQMQQSPEPSTFKEEDALQEAKSEVPSLQKKQKNKKKNKLPRLTLPKKEISREDVIIRESKIKDIKAKHVKFD